MMQAPPPQSSPVVVLIGREGDDDDNEGEVDRNEADFDATNECGIIILGETGPTDVEATLPRLVLLVLGSTSTTRNTALPSKILRTLSASQSPAPPLRDVEAEEDDEDPVKASQNALRNLRNTV